MNHFFKNKIKSSTMIFLIGILMISAYGMEKDPDYQAPQIKQASEIKAPTDEKEICPEGWAWREKFKITIDGKKHKEITSQINEVHLNLARQEEWVYSQIKDTKGIIPAVNVAFARIGILLKQGDYYRYETIPLMHPKKQKEYVFLSGRAFSDDVSPSLESLEEKFLTYSNKPKSLTRFIKERFSDDNDSPKCLLSLDCLRSYKKQIFADKNNEPVEETFFNGLGQLGFPYLLLEPEQIKAFVNHYRKHITDKINTKTGDWDDHDRKKYFYKKIGSALSFEPFSDSFSDFQNAFVREDFQHMGGLVAGLNNFFKSTSHFRNPHYNQKFVSLYPYVMEWLQACGSLCQKFEGILSKPQEQKEADQRVTSDEFTGHTEQNLLYFLNTTTEFCKQVEDKLSSYHKEGSPLLGMILHIHSRLDVCERCAPSIARELEFVRYMNEESIFTKLIQKLQRKEKIFFNILVSSRHPYPDRETGEQGYRRKIGYDSDHDSSLELLKDYDKFFMKVLGTFPPNNETTY